MSTPSQPQFGSSSDWNQPGQPAWRIALFYPPQGSWTETDYLELEGGPLVEFDSGCVEVLDMPTKEHQRIVQFLFVWLREFVLAANLGEVFIAPLPVRLWPEKFREPDVLFLRHGRAEHRGYPDGADLVIEVVSPDPESRRRDKDVKTAEYCRAKIAEYWIVDPEQETIKVLFLAGDDYETYGEFQCGAEARSKTLPGLTVSVDDVLAAARGLNP
jgi:Uma2 family endonuclease